MDTVELGSLAVHKWVQYLLPSSSEDSGGPKTIPP
jgi:hypothetical protein